MDLDAQSKSHNKQSLLLIFFFVINHKITFNHKNVQFISIIIIGKDSEQYIYKYILTQFKILKAFLQSAKFYF